MTPEYLSKHCFTEQKEYSCEKYREIFEELLKKGLCKLNKNGTFCFDFVGFISVSNDIFVVFPKGYRDMADLDSYEIKNHIGVLFSVLMRYRNEGTIKPEEKELLGSRDDDCYEGIAAAFWLINDYQEYGFIRRERVSYCINCGNNINWPRTIKTQQPLFSKGRPVYTDLVIKKTDSDNASILYRLHRYVICRSYRKYGWLIFTAEGLNDPEFEEMPCSKEMALNILGKELERTFVEREIQLIKIMQEFIGGSGKDETRSNFESLAAPYFHRIWEAICKYLFHDKYDVLKSLLPQAVWHVPGRESNVPQIPDILFMDEDTLYILDAKYYNVTKNLPGWPDLVKQFFYCYSLKSNHKGKFENVLIFPGHTDRSVDYFGYVDFDKFKELGRVDSVCVDIYEAMTCYGHYSSGLYRQFLVRELEDNR